MSIPTVRGMRMPLFTLSAVFFVALFWFFRPSEPQVVEPAPEWQWLSAQWLQPVAEQRLTAEQLRTRGGALWLEVSQGQARLLYRLDFVHEETAWRAQAGLQAATQDLQALATELQLKDSEQILTVEQAQAFDKALVEQLWLESKPALTTAQWQASAGEPRLKLQMPEGQAWVYPPLGLTAHTQDQQVTLIHQVSAQAMRGQR